MNLSCDRRFKFTWSTSTSASFPPDLRSQVNAINNMAAPRTIKTDKAAGAAPAAAAESRIKSSRSSASVHPVFPHLFAGIAFAILALYQWPLRWLLSGAAPLTYVLLLGAAQGHHVVPLVNVWSLAALLNLTYWIAATSWLLYWVFLVACYPSIFLACIFQFDLVAKFVRRRLRQALKELQFTNDKIAFFNLPALEIDVDVEGLMCIRGISISVSTLAIVAHGVEVGIKFTDDMELAIVTDKVTISLFRRIDIDDVYANLKGGQYEMTFGKLAPKTKDVDGEPLMVENTPMLAAAAANGDTRSITEVTMAQRMTDGNAPDDASIKSGFASVQGISPDDDHDAKQKYHDIMDQIHKTSSIQVARKEARADIRNKGDEEAQEILKHEKDFRAAVCTQLHDKPTIAHPSTKAIKVSTIKSMYPRIRKQLHRFPLLLRAQLNPIAYFHPVYITSITAGGSGSWLQHMLSDMVFKDYAEDDSEVRKLKQRVSAWLADANFVIELGTITGLASVPMNTDYDILTNLRFDDIIAHRTLPKEVNLEQIIRLGGADATIKVPSFLLPHHEHLLPPKPTQADFDQFQKNVDEADGQPKTVQAQAELDQLGKDEANVNVSAHLRLPACLDQSLLDFVAALVKVTKVIEYLKTDSPLDTWKLEKENEHHGGIREFAKALKGEVKEKMNKAIVDAAANDRWIAKLVGKVTKHLESMQGDIGYSGDLPVALKVYRDQAEPFSKIMP